MCKVQWLHERMQFVGYPTRIKMSGGKVGTHLHNIKQKMGTLNKAKIPLRGAFHCLSSLGV